MAKETMRAVVFHGPFKVAVEERPIPRIQDANDIIVKTSYTALCGRYVQFPFHNTRGLDVNAC